MSKRFLSILPLFGACEGDPHGHEGLWDQKECQSPTAEQYWDGSDVIGCVRDIKQQIENHDGERATFDPETGRLNFIQTEDKDGRLGPEEHNYTQALKEASTKGLDHGYETIRGIYTEESDPNKRWIVDKSEPLVRWASDTLTEHHTETVKKRYVTPFDINHDGYQDSNDDLNNDNRITREDWELSKKK